MYEAYLSDQQIRESVANKSLFEGKLRINPRNYEDAFITDPLGLGSDIYIQGLSDRNRALNNDIVAFQLKPKYQWKLVDQFRQAVLDKCHQYNEAQVKVGFFFKL